jgi:DNA-binding response OmpR family regulator
MTESARILIVEDDESIQLGLRMNLERAGYQVGMASDGEAGLEALRDGSWDVCILDVMMPRLNGYEVLRSLRDLSIDTEVLVLSARDGEQDKVVGLDLGADDYITKPFSVPELLARVRAAVRRRQALSASGTAKVRTQILRFGDVAIDTATREVHRREEPVDLTVTEFNVLEVLARAGGGAMTREQIFEAVWGEGHHGTHRTIDNFMAQLRGKLEDNPAAPTLLLTVRGVGYRLAT